MADYYPLISRAVAGLDKNSGETRRVVYERARSALLAQLRGVTPALNESDITRERLALEEAIRKVEAESARQFVDTTRAQPGREDAFRAAPPPRARASEPERRDETPRAQPRQLPTRPEAPPAARRPATPSAPPMPGPRLSESMFDQPLAPEPAPQAPPARHPLRRQERRSLSDSGLNDFRNVVSEASELGGASARAARSARDAYAATQAPAMERHEPKFDRGEAHAFEPHAPQERPHEDFPEPMLEPSFTVDEARPVPPKGRRPPPAPIEDEEEFAREEVRPRRSFGSLIRAAAALLIVAGLAGLVVWQWSNMVALYRVFRAPSTEVATREPPTTQRKTQERIEPGTQPDQQAQAGAAVAQKVVLYEEDPADPQGKRYVGSALWRTETVSPGPGQPPELAIRADVEVPERKLAMIWSLRRNTDKGLPASHTVEIMFKLPADFPAGGISNVPGILMKQAEQTRGVPLAGLAVKVTNGFFLIGLSAVDTDRERNVQLLKERAWFDIPVVYTNNRRAILAMEKGTPGERAFAEAFKVWKQ